MTLSPETAASASAFHCSAVGATFGTLSHQANWRTSPSVRTSTSLPSLGLLSSKPAALPFLKIDQDEDQSEGVLISTPAAVVIESR